VGVWEGGGEAHSGNAGRRRPVRGELELTGGNGGCGGCARARRVFYPFYRQGRRGKVVWERNASPGGGWFGVWASERRRRRVQAVWCMARCRAGLPHRPGRVASGEDAR
jgi:hypothetical protein